jgi:hypothetical protein
MHRKCDAVFEAVELGEAFHVTNELEHAEFIRSFI